MLHPFYKSVSVQIVSGHRVEEAAQLQSAAALMESCRMTGQVELGKSQLFNRAITPVEPLTMSIAPTEGMWPILDTP